MAEKYNVVIKNNETGEILENFDCSCIIGGFADDEETNVLCINSCKLYVIKGCIEALQQGIKNRIKKDTDLQMSMLMSKVIENRKEDNENE